MQNPDEHLLHLGELGAVTETAVVSSLGFSWYFDDVAANKFNFVLDPLI